MHTDRFHFMIKDTIEKCSYPVYVIHPIREIICPCMNHATKQADPNCIKCLGTGSKIKIKKIKVARNDMETSTANRGAKGAEASLIAKKYFVDEKYNLEFDDVIIDDNEAFYVYRIQSFKALGGFMTHQQVQANPKKNDHATLIRNFNKIMEQYKKMKGGKL